MFKRIFLRGLLAITPLAITVAVVIWLYDVIESAFSAIVRDLFGTEYYFPGLGILLALAFIFFFGVLINSWLIQKLYSYMEKILHKMPLIKTLYRSVTDLMSFFRSDSEISKSGVVMVELAGVRLLGLVTREVFDDLPEGIGKEDEVAVYLPMSYQIGGYTVMISRSKIHPVDMKVDHGLRYAVTAGIKSKSEQTESITSQG